MHTFTALLRPRTRSFCSQTAAEPVSSRTVGYQLSSIASHRSPTPYILSTPYGLDGILGLCWLYLRFASAPEPCCRCLRTNSVCACSLAPSLDPEIMSPVATAFCICSAFACVQTASSRPGKKSPAVNCGNIACWAARTFLAPYCSHLPPTSVLDSHAFVVGH